MRHFSKNITIRLFRRLIILWLTFFPWGFADAKHVENDGQIWNSIMAQGPISSSPTWRLYLEAQPRFGGDVTYIDRLLLRPAIYFQLNKNWSFWQGYLWQPVFHPTYSNEHRLWQQVLYEHRFSAVNWINRFRLEERFIQNGEDLPIRFRYFSRMPIPMINSSGTQNAHFLVLQNELFINLNTTSGGPRAGFDQNRVYIAWNHRITRWMSFDSGYLFNYVHRPLASTDRINHAWLTNLYFNWD